MIKSRRFNNFFFAVLITAFLFMPLSVWADAQGQLKNVLNSIQSIEANFSQSLYNSHKQLLKSYQGHMMLMRPNRFRWDIQMPIEQLTISNGSVLWVYDPNLKQVTVQKLQKDKMLTPAMILSGTATGVLNNFYISKMQDWFILKPKISSMIKKVSLKFIGQQLTQMQIQDSLDQISEIRFSRIQINQRIPSDSFKFSAPRNTDVIQLS